MNKRIKNIFTFSMISLLITTIFLLTFKIVTTEKPEQIRYSEPAAIRVKAMVLPVVKLSHRGERIADGSKFSTSATGFSISYDVRSDSSLILTNDHFCRDIDPHSSLVIENYNREQIDWSEEDSDLKVMKTSPALDLCIIQARGFIKPVKIIDDLYYPQIFEKVYIIGAPAGDFPIILDTYISSFLDRNKVGIPPLSLYGNKFIMVSEEILPGHSGSPVYTLDGEVIGILFGALPHYGGIAVSADDIKFFLDN
jgi:S1-C subfamily serine protease